MPNVSSLDGLRHESDLAAAMRADGPWSEPAADERRGALGRMLDYLVAVRRENPPRESDRAFVRVPDAVAAAGSDEREAVSVLAQLERAALVERIGGRVNDERWRATDHALHAADAAMAPLRKTAA